MTSKEYHILLRYATSLSISNESIDPADLVGEAVLAQLDSGLEFNLLEVKKKIQSALNHFKKYTIEKKNYYDFAKSYTDKVCKDCKEVKPAAAFYICDFGYTRVLSSYCKECSNKRWKEKSSTPEYKLYNAKKQKKWRDDHKAKWKAYTKQRREQAKRDLTDDYIIRCLTSPKLPRKFLQQKENYHFIEAYRQKKLKERKEKKHN